MISRAIQCAGSAEYVEPILQAALDALRPLT
jgi:hypothetical protein